MSWDIHSLFLKHAKELTRSLRRRGLTEDSAADITQDTFLRMLNANPSGSSDNPRAYLFRVSHNLVIDHQRRQRALPIDQISEEALLEVADPTPSAETALYDKQRLRISEAALAELPQRTRRAFELYRLEELTIAEVAPQIGLSSTQTWALIRGAYRHIRSRLRDV
ncbi:sigma-70 family RNA polymerase sigma factor [Agrobacterium tumefaciens]|uniref:sigma-70 family RNA polymerase sigma factor n=1 Tax=Agrobacterium tumefaciens TaxID=358 RepID=UPI00157294EA|nr:sigma-70 family RNA polymerase sigma factor [Agrobacterium tumefaciens]WCK05676.1 sigma-70 family RNA polymerase sigma factor [Agrobacterium tumefaciens]